MHTSKLKTVAIAGMLGIVGGLLVNDAFATPTSPTTLYPSQDAMIFGKGSNGSDTNMASGKGPAFFAGADGNSEIKRSLVQFDVSSLAGVTVTSVELDLILGQIAGSGGGGGGGGGCGMGCTYPNRVMSVYTVSTAWNEGPAGTNGCGGVPCTGIGGTGHGWPESTGDVTWSFTNYSGSQWAGSTSTPQDQDYNSTPVVVQTFSAPFSLGDVDSFTGDTTTNPNFTQNVQDWIDNTIPNYGWIIQSNLESSPTSFLGWWSRDGAINNSNTALNPALIVTF